MKIINTQQELEALIDDDNNIVIDDDLMLNCNIEVKANIIAWDINARDIKAGNINAQDIKALDIKAENILYYAVCFAYNSISCKSIKGKRFENSKHFALDGTITETNNEKSN